jgi:hypothetical protein
MLHIIGVDHRYAQARSRGAKATETQQTFTRLLMQTILEVHPTFVSEEDSEEALAGRQQISIAKELADAQGIEHRFCDPTSEQRRALRYKDGQTLEIEIIMHDDQGLSNEEIHLKARAIELGRYFPIRERFWLGRLDGCRDHDVIFVCGDAHVESFTALLEREGIQHRIVERGIGVSEADHEDFCRIVAYLTAHPELRNDE